MWKEIYEGGEGMPKKQKPQKRNELFGAWGPVIVKAIIVAADWLHDWWIS